MVSLRTTSARILGYTLVLWALTVAFSPVAGMGHLYLGSAIVLGGVFTWYAVRLCAWATGPATSPSSGGAGELQSGPPPCGTFTWSITYITLLFGAMAVDQLLRTGW